MVTTVVTLNTITKMTQKIKDDKDIDNCHGAKHYTILQESDKGQIFWGNNVKLVMHQISVDKIENPCY